MSENKNKKILLKSLSAAVKKLRGNLSQSKVAIKGDISTSTVNLIEHATKDPQFTTLYKLAETFEIDFAEFAKLIQNEIPKGISLIEK